MSEFNTILKNKPQAGEILKSKHGEYVKIHVEMKPAVGDRPEMRMMFCNASIDAEATGWYLTNDIKGLKCLILPDAQAMLYSLNNDSYENLQIKQLKIVKENKTKTALLCELCGVNG